CDCGALAAAVQLRSSCERRRRERRSHIRPADAVQFSVCFLHAFLSGDGSKTDVTAVTPLSASGSLPPEAPVFVGAGDTRGNRVVHQRSALPVSGRSARSWACQNRGRPPAGGIAPLPQPPRRTSHVGSDGSMSNARHISTAHALIWL